MVIVRSIWQVITTAQNCGDADNTAGTLGPGSFSELKRDYISHY